MTSLRKKNVENYFKPSFVWHTDLESGATYRSCENDSRPRSVPQIVNDCNVASASEISSSSTKSIQLVKINIPIEQTLWEKSSHMIHPFPNMATIHKLFSNLLLKHQGVRHIQECFSNCPQNRFLTDFLPA